MRRRPDVPSLVAGLLLLAVGGVLLGDAAGAFDLTFELLAPLLLAATGAILLTLGLSRGS